MKSLVPEKGSGICSLRGFLWMGMVFFLTGMGSIQADAAGGKSCASLKQIRYWCNATYTRVVLDLDRKVDYKVNRLKEDKSAGKPSRIYIDLFHTQYAENSPRRFGLEQGPVACIRTAHQKKETERLVLDLRQAEQYKVFYLDRPARIVMDLWWTEQDKSGQERKGNPEVKGTKRQASLPLIVLDPGHGGVDPGAVGKRGLKEKDVVFSIAKRVKRILEQKKKARVILTRESDKFLPLENRTWIANSRGADLFVSVHANACPNRRVRGVETYYLDNTTDKAAIRLAALENRTAKRKTDDLQRILRDLRLSSNANASHQLAHTVQKGLIRGLRSRYTGVEDLGAKGNLFYVLIGAHMPSILVEVSFISNTAEEKRLRSTSYQKVIAQGIAEGIERFLDQHDYAQRLAGNPGGWEK